jgi:hypothetical protein
VPVKDFPEAPSALNVPSRWPTESSPSIKAWAVPAPKTDTMATIDATARLLFMKSLFIVIFLEKINFEIMFKLNSTIILHK